jgi:glycosyltransferase involved in cell wall biosynthesis
MNDGVTARVVHERDAAALARAITGLLAQRDTGRLLGASARARVERDFGWARVAERFEALYHASVEGHDGG